MKGDGLLKRLRLRRRHMTGDRRSAGRKQGSCPEISRATVYNTLNDLVKFGYSRTPAGVLVPQ
jgi:hypothetical protein